MLVFYLEVQGQYEGWVKSLLKENSAWRFLRNTVAGTNRNLHSATVHNQSNECWMY